MCRKLTIKKQLLTSQNFIAHSIRTNNCAHDEIFRAHKHFVLLVLMQSEVGAQVSERLVQTNTNYDLAVRFCLQNLPISACPV